MNNKQKILWLVAFFVLTLNVICKADNKSVSYEQRDSTTSSEDDGVSNSDDAIDYLIESKQALKKRLAMEQFEREEAAKREHRRKRWLAKEKKFKKFYTARNECDEVIWWSIRVECTNEKIKARKNFEKLYQERSLNFD